MSKIGKTDLPLFRAKKGKNELPIFGPEKGKNERVSWAYRKKQPPTLAAPAFLRLVRTATIYNEKFIILLGKVPDPFHPLLQNSAPIFALQNPANI